MNYQQYYEQTDSTSQLLNALLRLYLTYLVYQHFWVSQFRLESIHVIKMMAGHIVMMCGSGMAADCTGNMRAYKDGKHRFYRLSSKAYLQQ